MLKLLGQLWPLKGVSNYVGVAIVIILLCLFIYYAGKRRGRQA